MLHCMIMVISNDTERYLQNILAPPGSVDLAQVPLVVIQDHARFNPLDQDSGKYAIDVADVQVRLVDGLQCDILSRFVLDSTWLGL